MQNRRSQGLGDGHSLASYWHISEVPDRRAKVCLSEKCGRTLEQVRLPALLRVRMPAADEGYCMLGRQASEKPSSPASSQAIPSTASTSCSRGTGPRLSKAKGPRNSAHAATLLLAGEIRAHGTRLESLGASR